MTGGGDRATALYRLSWGGLSETRHSIGRSGHFQGTVNRVTEPGCLVLGCSLGPLRREFVHRAVKAKIPPFCFSHKEGIMFRLYEALGTRSETSEDSGSLERPAGWLSGKAAFSDFPSWMWDSNGDVVSTSLINTRKPLSLLTMMRAETENKSLVQTTLRQYPETLSKGYCAISRSGGY